MKKWLALRFYEFELGRTLGYNSLSFVLQLALLLAIFMKTNFGKISGKIYLLIGLAILLLCFLIWLWGFVLIRTGFLEDYQLHSPIYKRMLDEIKKHNGV